MSYLSIRDIKKSFNKIEVLKGVDLEIEKGRVYLFLRTKWLWKDNTSSYYCRS